MFCDFDFCDFDGTGKVIQCFSLDMPPNETVIKVPANPLNVEDIRIVGKVGRDWICFWCGLLVKEFQSNNKDKGN